MSFGCGSSNESLDVFSENIYKSILSRDKTSIKEKLIKPEEYARLEIEKNNLPDINHETVVKLRSALIKQANFSQAISIAFHNSSLENFYNKVEGKGFYIKDISTEDLDNLGKSHLQKSLVILLGTPKNDIEISFNKVALIDGSWKIILGYKVDILR